jgi:hypothetical protein
LALEREIIAQRAIENHGVARFPEQATVLIAAGYPEFRGETSACVSPSTFELQLT